MLVSGSDLMAHLKINGENICLEIKAPQSSHPPVKVSLLIALIQAIRPQGRKRLETFMGLIVVISNLGFQKAGNGLKFFSSLLMFKKFEIRFFLKTI